jgi:hypothetical protein
MQLATGYHGAKMDLALRPMSTSQVLDRTFSLYRQNFVLFAGITAFPPALLLIGQLLILLVTRPFNQVAPASPGDPAKLGAIMGGAVLGGLALLVVFMVGYAFAAGATVYAVSRVHLGYPTTIAECYRLIKPHFGNILGIVVLVGMCVGAVIFVGALFFLIPFFMSLVGRSGLASGAGVIGALVGFVVMVAGIIVAIYLSAKLSLSIPACVLENLGVTDSMRRSWSLSEGTVFRLILVSILAGAIAWILSMVLSIPYFIGLGVMVTKKDPSLMLPFVAWQYVAEFLARTLAGPIGAIAAALIYYDQRVRKEAFDLQLMMQAIGQAPPPQAVSAASPGSIG